MSTGAIAGHQIFASSSHAHPGCGISSSRLNQFTNPVGSWCAGVIDENQWLQINLGGVHHVTAISTQGRAFANEWVTSYWVSYSLDGDSWRDYQDGRVNSDNFLSFLLLEFDFFCRYFKRMMIAIRLSSVASGSLLSTFAFIHARGLATYLCAWRSMGAASKALNL